jgi:hypothetical protein
MARTQRGPWSTAAEARLRDEKSGEREYREIEGLGANQRVSCVAGDEAELIGAMDVTGARRRSRNGRWCSTGARAVRERGARGSAEKRY